MSDIDPPSDLRERLADLEADLARVREGKKPTPQVDLMTWSATPRPSAPKPASLLETIRQSLRDNWTGFNEALMSWAARIDERFAGR